MCKLEVIAEMALALAMFGLPVHGQVEAQPVGPGDDLVIRLVHPERQAAAVLDLFKGAPVAHPAAALASWKRCSQNPNLLGKPLEAGIAMFNPEMAREWKVLHEAELRISFEPTDGKPRWYAIVPHDDGTLSAAVTAMRVTGGAADRPVSTAGREIAVDRLGPAGSVVSLKLVDLLVFGGSPEDLARGLSRIESRPGSIPEKSDRAEAAANFAMPRLASTIDSGVYFDVDAGRLTVSAGPAMLRRLAAFLQGIGSRRLGGSLAVEDDRIVLSVTTSFASDGKSNPLPPAKPAVVDVSWLRWVPARGAMGLISVAFASEAAFWETAFGLADRIERTDPSRGNVAPLRARFNLLATAAGARPEVDLWPHLKGVTACAMADPNQPGRPDGGLVVLHTDAEASAERLASDVVPRLCGLVTGKKPPGQDAPGGPLRKAAAPQIVGAAPRRETLKLGTVSGRPLFVFCRGLDVVIAWGDEVLSASIAAAAMPDRSVAPLCTDWARRGKNPPQRLGAIWPARCWSPLRGVDTATAAWQVLTQDPPAVWWGWTEQDKALDSVHFAGLRQRVHRFLDQLPLDPFPIQ